MRILQLGIVLCGAVLVSVAACGKQETTSQAKKSLSEKTVRIVNPELQKRAKLADPSLEIAATTTSPAETELTETTPAEVVNTDVNPEPSETEVEQVAAVPQLDAKPKDEVPAVTFEDVQSKADEAVRAAQAFAKAKEAQYYAKIDKRLAQFNAKLDAVRQKAHELSLAAKQKIALETATLSEEMTLSQQELASLGVSNEDKFKQLDVELEQMLTKIQESLVSQSTEVALNE